MTDPKDIKIAAPEQFALLNDPDFLNQAVTRFLQQFLEAEITSFLQAEPYQRTSERTGYRNGYKPRVSEDTRRPNRPERAPGSGRAI